MVDDLKQAMDALVDRAKAVAAIRSDITTDEAMGLIIGACMGAQQAGLDDASCQRMVQIVCDGMRAPVPS